MPELNFHVADLTPTGERQLLAEYGYAQLEQIPGAAEIMVVLATQLYRSPDEFEIPFPYPGSKVTLRFSATSNTSGIVTVRYNSDLASVSLLASGKDQNADHTTFEAFQLHLLRQLHDTGHEPSFALMEIKERPLVATVNFLSPPEQGPQLIVALADRCFAAVYFRRHGLA